MKPKRIFRIVIDICMTAALLLLMTYEMIGAEVHEWIGIAVFTLFIIHHILNGYWLKNLFHGKYTPVRIVQTVLVILVLITMLGSMISGIILSRHVFSFLNITSGRSLARTVHMICAYWGFILVSLHKAEQLWRRRDDFEMILVTDNGGIFITEGLEDKFTLNEYYGNLKGEVIYR